MTELVNFIYHIMKIFDFLHKLAFKQVVRFLKSFSIFMMFYVQNIQIKYV